MGPSFSQDRVWCRSQRVAVWAVASVGETSASSELLLGQLDAHLCVRLLRCCVQFAGVWADAIGSQKSMSHLCEIEFLEFSVEPVCTGTCCCSKIRLSSPVLPWTVDAPAAMYVRPCKKK